MAFSKEQRDLYIAQIFIHLKYAQEKPATIAQNLHISKQTVYNYIHYLIANGHLYKDPKTNNLKPRYKIENKTYVLAELDESAVWEEFIAPKVAQQKQNVIEILEYGFTEILNKKIDQELVEIFGRLKVENSPTTTQVQLLEGNLKKNLNKMKKELLG